MITALKVPALNESGNRSQRLPSAGNVAHGVRCVRSNVFRKVICRIRESLKSRCSSERVQKRHLTKTAIHSRPNSQQARKERRRCSAKKGKGQTVKSFISGTRKGSKDGGCHRPGDAAWEVLSGVAERRNARYKRLGLGKERQSSST